MTVKATEYLGKPIGFPGWYHGVPMETYHSGAVCVEPSVSSSVLRKVMNDSPAHAWDESPLNPDRDPESGKVSESLTVGRATHHLLLGEKEFRKQFIIRPDKAPDGRDWNGNNLTCKKWLSERAGEGLTVITKAQLERIEGMAVSLARHPLIKAGILNGQIELSGFWKDEETGLWVKIRPDAVPGDGLDYADLKTISGVDDHTIRTSIGEYGYHQQGALVREGARRLLKLGKTDQVTFSLIFIESKRPYCVRVVTLKDGDLDRGEAQNHAALTIFARCLKEKHWPGPGGDQTDAAYMEMMEWRQKQIDDQLGLKKG